jgi:predicted MFS family arabinose efflux permease
MADRYGHRQVFAVIALISVAPIFILTHLPPVSLGLALLTTTVFMVCTSGRFVPGMALITSCVPPQVRGGFMSLNIAVQQAAAGLASLGAGVVLTRNATGQIEHYGSVGLFAMGMTLLAIALAWSLRPPPGPPNT